MMNRILYRFVNKMKYVIKNVFGWLAPRTPSFLKPIFRPLFSAYGNTFRYLEMITGPKTREEIHEYWKRPWGTANCPQDYLQGEPRSLFLVELAKRCVAPSASLLEVGCNVGRNLNFLFINGFQNLAGIEISEDAVSILKQSYPEMAKKAVIYNEAAERSLSKLGDEAFDLIFTMAVLQHIHPSSEFIFHEMARITRHFLITIEDERIKNWRHYPRNYQKVFDFLGLEQVEEINCSEVPGLGKTTMARVFKKCKNTGK